MRPALRRGRTALLLILVLTTSLGLTLAGSARNSATFDEINHVADGVRGLELGHFDLTPDHPPLLKMLYGAAALGGAPLSLPDERLAPRRWDYARALLWQTGNDGHAMLRRARLAAAIWPLALVLLAFALVRRTHGDGPALVTALLVAFLPDVLAHGGIAYGDVASAAALVAGTWALDALVRRPTAGRAAVAGLAVGLALGIKYNAIVLGPIACELALAELLVRGRDRRWLGRLLRASGVALAASYVTCVALSLGDLALFDLREGLLFKLGQAASGGGSPAFLFGHVSDSGFRTFYPVVFFLKTPVAFQVLSGVALVAAIRGRESLRQRLASPLRGVVLAAAVYLVVLISAGLNIGFRHALPALALLTIAVGARLGRLLQDGTPRVRAALHVLLAAHVVSAAAAYPFFLGYTSELVPGPRRAARVLADSSLDWGQGLLELRAWMTREGVETVSLAYFGSALPEAYGIDHVPLPSHLARPPRERRPDAAPPAYVVISATHLAGLYVRDDPYRVYREREPVAILGRSLHVFRADEADWE